MRRSRFAAALLVLPLALVTPAVPATASPSPAPAPDLATTVRAKIVDTATRASVTAADTEVNVMRSRGGTWAFGAAVALAPHVEGAYPEGWLFVAERTGPKWTVAFEGEAAFPALTAAAPAAVVSAKEKKIFAGHGPGARKTPSRDAKPLAGDDFRTGMRWPWAVGQTWRLTGGPHGAARQSVDLAGGDGRVLAARGGTFYVMCSSQRGWVRVAHDRGYSTDYYHLHDNRTDNGATVAEGEFLGNIGVDVSCGGSATGPHNHFSLRQNAVYVGIAAHNFGKWQPYNGAAEYQGYALHGSTQVGIGGSMYNHGALGFTEGIVDTNGGGVLNRRSGPGTGYGVVGTVADGATVSVACSAGGTTHTGRFGYTTAMWNRLTDGSWISDAYTWTGTGNPLNGWC